MDEIKTNKYVNFLEETVKSVMTMEPAAVAVVGVLQDGNVFTGYYNCRIADLVAMAHSLYFDSIMNEIRERADEVKEALDELEEGG